MRRPLYLGFLPLIFAVLHLLGSAPTEAAGCTPHRASALNLCRIVGLDSGPEIFAAPERPANSLFGQGTYAWLEDNANVYPAPNRNVAPKRNVGVGYLYVTVNRSLVNEAGETWYEINSGSCSCSWS